MTIGPGDSPALGVGIECIKRTLHTSTLLYTVLGFKTYKQGTLDVLLEGLYFRRREEEVKVEVRVNVNPVAPSPGGSGHCFRRNQIFWPFFTVRLPLQNLLYADVSSRMHISGVNDAIRRQLCSLHAAGTKFVSPRTGPNSLATSPRRLHHFLHGESFYRKGTRSWRKGWADVCAYILRLFNNIRT